MVAVGIAPIDLTACQFAWQNRSIMENNRTEYKRLLTDDFEKKAVAFLNSRDGGHLYIGIEDDGTVCGIEDIDDIQKRAAQRLGSNILPTALGLYEITVEPRDGKSIVHIYFASGPQKPYYIAQYGMSPKGCYMRDGTIAVPMPVEKIEELRSSRIMTSLIESPSYRKELTFRQLKIIYEENGHPLNEQFMRSLNLMTGAREPNYIAYLMSDENGNSMKIAKFAGEDKGSELIENYEYGYCCLLKAVQKMLDRVEVENTTITKVTFKNRIETTLIDEAAVKEAIINAAVHNDWTNEIPPVVIFYSDRVEITNMGGLPYGISETDFFDGSSRPRNPGIMRIFRDTDMVEQLGRGLPKITRVYGKEAFRFYRDHITVVLSYNKEVLAARQTLSQNDTLTDTINDTLSDTIKLSAIQKSILDCIAKDSAITAEEIVIALYSPIATIKRALKALQDKNIIRRTGARKNGYWEILK
jgi:predicted HTH transcriptional regulator